MRTVRSRLPLTLLSSAIVVMLAACGGGDDEAAPTSTAPTLAFTDPQASVDLANYRLVGAYALPVGTGSNQLAEEASAITYNKDTGTLFIAGDEGTGIVEVSKQGVKLSEMALTGTADVEGIAYLGGGQFIYVEERLRSLHRFTYTAGGTVAESTTASVTLGSLVGNIGIEGASFDPATGGFIAVKETSPSQVFRTDVTFAVGGPGTSSNGTASTEPTNLFDPAKAGLPAFNDVFALGNAVTAADADYRNLLIVSASAGKIVKMDRAGNLLGTLDIGAAQNEGLTMDDQRVIYTVNENGAGGTGHPQMLVFAPTTSANAVGVGSNLYLGFTGAVSAGTGSLTLSDGAGDVRTIAIGDATQVQFKGGTVVVNPTLDLRPGHSYRITYPAGVVKVAGADAPAVTNVGALAFKADGSVDTTAPTLVSSTPADNTNNVAASASISLVFSEKVRAASGNIVIDNGAGDRRVIPVGDAQVTVSRDIVSIVPSTALNLATTYSVQIAAGAFVDASGNAYAGIADTTTLNFTTAPPPSVLQAGDVAFVGVNGDAVDAVAFALLKPVNAGTTIGFTDKDYTAAGGFPTNEAAYLWTADVAYPAGTIVTFTVDLTTPTVDKGTVTGKGGGISTGAETIYAFQGTIAGVGPGAAGAITVDRFLAAINIGTAAGEIPTELSTANAYIATGADDNAKYTGSMDRSDLAVFAARVRDISNWSFNDLTAYPLTGGSLFP
jgi:uncharacterized protein YjiK/methionine-rich copper-binding protein CopC